MSDPLAVNPTLSLEVQLELALRLTVGLILGAVIGFERELKGKPAGLRTNILICMAAVLFAEISQRAALRGGPCSLPVRASPAMPRGRWCGCR